MKNIPKTLERAHTQICGKPSCLPGKPWRPRGLDSLRKHHSSHSAASVLRLLGVNSRRTARKPWADDSHSPSTISRGAPASPSPLRSQMSHLNFRLKQQGVGEERRTTPPRACLCCLPFISELASSRRSERGAQNSGERVRPRRSVFAH